MMRKKMTVRQKIFLIMAVLWMAVIFTMSARPAEVSEKDSSFFSKRIVKVSGKDLTGMDRWEEEAFMDKTERIVRKSAHAAEYMVLAILLTGTLSKLPPDRKEVAVILLFCILYAAGDELHQFFVPGRGPGVKDVLIDSLGASAGLAATVTALYTVSRCLKTDRS